MSMMTLTRKNTDLSHGNIDEDPHSSAPARTKTDVFSFWLVLRRSSS